MPKVSLGLPVYNADRFIRKTLDSLLSQTFSDLELIISDNASGDKTQEICEQYASADGRISYHRNRKNFGAVYNFNRTFYLSSGEYFKWASSDDLVAPTYLERCVNVLDKYPEVVICYPKTTIIDDNDLVALKYEDKLNLRSSSPHKRLRQFLRKPAGCNPIFGLMRATVLRDTTLFHTYEATDYNLLAQMCLCGQFFELSERLFYRRDHSQMWRRACHTSRDLALWLDTTYRGPNLFPALRVLTNLIKCVLHTPITRYEKMLCLTEIPRSSLILASRAVDWIRARSDPGRMY